MPWNEKSTREFEREKENSHTPVRERIYYSELTWFPKKQDYLVVKSLAQVPGKGAPALPRIGWMAMDKLLTLSVCLGFLTCKSGLMITAMLTSESRL